MVESYGEFFYLYNPIPLEKHEANLVINLILKTNNIKYEIGQNIDLNESFKDDVVNRLRFKNYFERLEDSGDQRGYSIEGFMCGLFGGELNNIREDSWDFKVDDITIQQKHIASNDNPRLISYKGIFNSLSGESIQKLNTFCEEHTDKEEEIKSHLFTYELPTELNDIKKEILEKRILFDYLIISTFEGDKLISHLISKEKLIELCLNPENIRRSKSIYNIRISKKTIIQHGKSFEIIKPSVTTEECGYLLTMDNKKRKTSEIFGEYGSKIRPDVLDWIASQPRKFLNEAEEIVKELERIREIEDKVSPSERNDSRIKQIIFTYLDTILEDFKFYRFEESKSSTFSHSIWVINPKTAKQFLNITGGNTEIIVDYIEEIGSMFNINNYDFILGIVIEWVNDKINSNYTNTEESGWVRDSDTADEIKKILQFLTPISTNKEENGAEFITEEESDDKIKQIIFIYLDTILYDFKNYPLKHGTWFINPKRKKFALKLPHLNAEGDIILGSNIIREISLVFGINSFNNIVEYILEWYNKRFQTNYKNSVNIIWTDYNENVINKIINLSTINENKYIPDELIFSLIDELTKDCETFEYDSDFWMVNKETEKWYFVTHDNDTVVYLNYYFLKTILSVFNIETFDEAEKFVVRWINKTYGKNIIKHHIGDDFYDTVLQSLFRSGKLVKENMEYEFDENENKLKEIIFNYLDLITEDYKIFKVLNSIWLINPRTNKWVFEYQKSGMCWFNDEIESEVRTLFGIESVIYNKLVIKGWVRNKLNNYVPYLSFTSNFDRKIKEVLNIVKKTRNKEEMGEQDTTTPSGPPPSYPAVTKWESGVKRGPANTIDPKSKWSEVVPMVRGKANPIDQNSKWDSGVTRGKANTLL